MLEDGEDVIVEGFVGQLIGNIPGALFVGAIIIGCAAVVLGLSTILGVAPMGQQSLIAGTIAVVLAFVSIVIQQFV